MIYQDIWYKNGEIKKGKRNCSDRYDIVSEFCSSYSRRFYVLDIGANMCYFGLRLTNEFKCDVMAFEFNSFEMREKHVKKNGNNRLIFLKRKISLSDLRSMRNYMHFDLVLAMSVLHHLPGNSTEWINEFKGIGKNVIIEFALDDSKRVSEKQGYKIPENSQILGYGDSHLKENFKRPIILL